MHRKDFLKTCGVLILGGLFLPGLSGCSTARFINSTRKGDVIVINRQDIMETEEFVLIDTPFFAYPLFIVKDGDAYISILTKCTHMGCALDVYSDRLKCPCHGSEFNFKGEVLLHPADVNLLTFPTTWDEQFIYINMKG